MPETDKLRATLLERESQLLDPAVRASAAAVEDLLDDEFREIGASGTTYDKATTLKELETYPGFDGPRSIENFQIAQLSDSIALATYRITEDGSLRSSIWQFKRQAWRLVFHQGTRGST